MAPLAVLALVALSASLWGRGSSESSSGVLSPSDCEVCALVATELSAALAETSKTHRTIETANGVVRKYLHSEIRLLEALEGLCDRFKDYSVHKERQGLARFARGRSQTMETLEGLVAKGVKVDLGIPHELWDSPSAEITELKTRCEWATGEWDEHFEEWFESHQSVPLKQFLCEERALRGKDQACLKELVSSQPTLKGHRGEL